MTIPAISSPEFSDAPSIPPLLESVSLTSNDESNATDAGAFAGVHSVLKSVDYWFDREVHDIEREADRLASSWAEENLPTLNGGTEDELPPEMVLARRCGELWKRWPERIKVKMQDAIDSGAAELGSRVASARAALTELKVTRRQLRDAESKIEELRAEMATRQGSVRYHRYFSRNFAWAMAALLVVVEFVANQPVFRILWPMQQSVASRITEEIEAAATSGWSSGVKIAALEIASYVEASLLAFAVVFLLFVLAKTVGSATRPLVALRSNDYPFASKTIDSLHRQKRLMLTIASLGTVTVIAFLYMSRGAAPNIVEQRASEAKANLTAITQKQDSLVAVGRDIQSTDAITKANAEAEVVRLENDLQFARNIAANNFSILILNISLVCFAVVVGFMADERDLTDTMGDHPDLARLREKSVRLTEAQVRYAADARDQLRLGEVCVNRIDSLLRSQPLATLEAKRQRLSSVVPRWRTLNAQLRGLDPSSIAAFRRLVVSDFPDISTLVQLVRPESLEQLAAELRGLSKSVYSAEQVLDQELAGAE